MNIYIPMLTVAIIISIILFIYITKNQKKNQINYVFAINIALVIILSLSVLCQNLFAKKLNIEPINFEYFSYIGGCFLPVSVFFTGLIFANTKIKFEKKYLLLFIVPIISLLVLWTNDYHHLFYKNYSVDFQTNEYGPYFTIHNIYSYALLILGILYMLKFSIKNSGFFSKQSILIVLGISVPVIVNILGTSQIIPMSIYITPITFTITIIFCAISIFKFQFLGVAPIASRKIVDRISDSYVVLDDDGNITDFNKTFYETFKLESSKIRGKSLVEILKKYKAKKSDINKLEKSIQKSKNSKETISFEEKIENINKYFTVEISSINSDKASLGILILFKDTTQHIKDMETIKNNQDILMERERLASLGQLIGGIAHNLKTPIMSISGAAEGLTDLINEYDTSIEDPEVNFQDHHDIANDMREWIKKIRSYTEYMSDIITAVKGQAVAMSEQEAVEFTIEELVKRVNILMRHELKNAIIYLNVQMKVDSNITIKGEINSLIQVINNMISNAIQAYNGKPEQNIDMIINKENNNLVISIRDYAGGLPERVKEKLFKEMVTTKGKNGTGLGLYMSYSNIRAYFGGNITYDSIDGDGTTFNIVIPRR